MNLPRLTLFNRRYFLREALLLDLPLELELPERPEDFDAPERPEDFEELDDFELRADDPDLLPIERLELDLLDEPRPDEDRLLADFDELDLLPALLLDVDLPEDLLEPLDFLAEPADLLDELLDLLDPLDLLFDDPPRELPALLPPDDLPLRLELPMPIARCARVTSALPAACNASITAGSAADRASSIALPTSFFMPFIMPPDFLELLRPELDFFVAIASLRFRTRARA